MRSDEALAAAMLTLLALGRREIERKQFRDIEDVFAELDQLTVAEHEERGGGSLVAGRSSKGHIVFP